MTPGLNRCLLAQTDDITEVIKIYLSMARLHWSVNTRGTIERRFTLHIVHAGVSHTDNDYESVFDSRIGRRRWKENILWSRAPFSMETENVVR